MIGANSPEGIMDSGQAVLTQFHPLITQWFQKRVGRPTDVQQRAWPKIAAEEHLLVTAPTGSGKTLTAFLWALNQLITGQWPTGQTNARIGELDEEFAWEAAAGDTFSLGTQNWRIERITHNDVFVLSGSPKAAAAPFWKGEENGRVRLLLDRYGILFRELLHKEWPTLRWSAIFRALRTAFDVSVDPKEVVLFRKSK
jgi:Lhr-like helicase